MDHPKFILSFDFRHVGCPFLIREYAVIDGKIASRPHSSYPKFKEAMKALCDLSGEEVILATLGKVNNTF